MANFKPFGFSRIIPDEEELFADDGIEWPIVCAAAT